MVNLPVYDLKINSLIKGYFSLYFNHRFLKHKYISRRNKRKSFNKIFVSKAEIKHTNNKALITLYVYNKERLSLLKKIRNLRSYFFKREINRIADK
jgi:F0F1-type ATP synthase delta subunit